LTAVSAAPAWTTWLTGVSSDSVSARRTGCAYTPPGTCTAILTATSTSTIGGQEQGALDGRRKHSDRPCHLTRTSLIAWRSALPRLLTRTRMIIRLVIHPTVSRHVDRSAIDGDHLARDNLHMSAGQAHVAGYTYHVSVYLQVG
jgi:hypothetical protein